tara:strand:+ start:5273 stop:5779 length:507 start_codon:yes stop_codon:yes gene_type:complete
MALKADRHELDVDISFFMNETGEKGQIVVASTGGSGAAMDQGQALVTIAAADATNIPVGVLLNDVVDLDLTRQHINFHKDEVQKGGKVSLLKKGYIVTDQIAGTPTIGALAFLDDADTGKFATEDEVADTKYSQVGRFMSIKDEDGYCKVEVNLPSPMNKAGAAGTDI